MAHGLSIWEEMPLYLKYLDKFSARHADSVRLLQGSPPTVLRALVHTLAGSCANLGLLNCSSLAARAEKLLAASEPAQAAVQELEQALQTALASIDRLQAAQAALRPPSSGPAKAGLTPGTDRAVVQELLRHMLHALDSDSLEPVEPVLEALRQCLPAQQLAALVAGIGDFDFRGAEQSTHALALELGMNLKGTQP
jgi:HPt (histidine-containing phosphotransfer) domain-containing protein